MERCQKDGAQASSNGLSEENGYSERPVLVGGVASQEIAGGETEIARRETVAGSLLFAEASVSRLLGKMPRSAK
jgi:hypothetical protein